MTLDNAIIKIDQITAQLRELEALGVGPITLRGNGNINGARVELDILRRWLIENQGRYGL